MALLISFSPSLPAVETEFSPSLQFSTGLAGGQNRLTWPAQAGTRYRIRSSGDLSSGTGGGGWRDRALVEAEGTSGMWLDPEPASPRAFYQVEPPQPEVFSVEPAVLSPGAVLVIAGQCLPPGSVVVFDIEGIPPVTAPIIVGPDGRMTVTLPAFDIIPPPDSGIGPHVTLARIVGPGGATVCLIGQTFEAAASGFADDAPPVMPLAGVAIPRFISVTKPATRAQAKTSEARNTIGTMRESVRIASDGENGSPGQRSLPGEVWNQECDLELAVPAGPPLAFGRTYRSMNQSSSACGTGWDHCYNVRITPIYDSAADPEPTRVAVHNGDGSVDVMHRQGAVYVCDGLFRTGVLNPDTSFTVTFADKSQFIFCPLVGAPWRGRIGSIVDRNGVALTCTYTAAGKLDQVNSQFGQSLTFGYDVAGRLVTVTDQTSRFISLSYYAAGEPGGNAGDLKSVSCPQIPGLSPVRGDTVYHYTTGSTDARLNSNLSSIHDGEGRLMTAWTYSASGPAAVDYDRCLTCDRQATDPTDPPVVFSYEILPPGSGGGAGGLLCISNDELGRVTETVCDRMHRPQSIRRYTTFATAGIACRSASNRPSDPPAGEPAFLETTFAWNPDHNCTRCTEPDGLKTLTTFDRELRRDCPRRERGNARVITIVSADTTEPSRTVTVEYLPGFGIVEGKKGLNAVNVRHMRANQSGSSSAGMRVRKGMQDIKNYARAGASPPGKIQSWVKDCFDRAAGGGFWDDDDDDDDGLGGDRSCNSPGNPIGHGLSVFGGRGGNIGATDFVTGGGQDDDGDGPFDDWSAQSNPIPGIGIVIKRHPPGKATARIVNPLYEGGGGAGNNPMYERSGFCTLVTTTLGQTFACAYDAHGNCTSSTTPIAGSGTVCTYNGLGQCTSVTVLNGPESSFTALRQYDPVTRYLTSDIVAPDVNGDGSGLSLTTILVRNPLGLITAVVDPRGNSTLLGYNACDQLVSVSSPPLGTDPATAARVVCTQFYDAGGLAVRCDLEHRDAAGALMAGSPVEPGNPHYTGFCVYDIRGRLVMVATEQIPINLPPGLLDPSGLDMALFNPKEYTLDRAGQCVRVSTPAASRNQAVAEVCDFTWDALGQLSSTTAGGAGMPGAVTTEFRMNLAQQVKRVTVRAAAGAVSPTVTCTYDAWRRPATCTDEMGNVNTFSYDNQGFTTVEVSGEVKDVPGSTGNVLLARTRGRDSSSKIAICHSTASGRVRSNNPSILVNGQTGRPLAHELAHVVQQRGDKPTAGQFNSLIDSMVNIVDDRFAAGAFFDVFTTDDVWTDERFAPGAPAPHATETTTVHHSPAGLPLSITCNGDTLQTFGYDAAGRTIVTANPGTLTRTCTLDACGNVIASTVTAHSTIPGTPNETFTTAATFDAACRQTSSTDGARSLKTMLRDSLRRITSVTSPGGLTTSYAYDTVSSSGTFASVLTTLPDSDGDGLPDYQSSSVCPGGVCRSVTDAAGYTTTFTCDSQNRVTRTDFPDGTFETTTFNELGHPVSHVRKNGAIMSADFDYKAQSTRVTVSNLPPGVVPVPPTEYVWNGLGQCVQVTEGTSVISCTHDSLSNRLSETQNGHTVTHTYNHRGCTGSTYPGGERFSEQRNAQGLLITFSIVNSGGVTLAPPITQCDYQGFACVREVRRNGVVTTCDYRSDGEPPLPFAGAVEDFSFGERVRMSVTNTTGNTMEESITRRNADQCVTLEQRVFADGPEPPSRRQTFTRDARNRVTRCVTQIREAAAGPVLTESDVRYVLDARGQRRSATGGSNPGLYFSSDTAPLFDDQVAQYSTWPGGAVHWNDDGDLSYLGRGAGGMALIYDAWSRLAGVLGANGAAIASYNYDAQSRRISSTLASNDPLVPPVTTFFLYDGPDCIQELDGNGIPEMTFAVSGGAHHCIITKNGSTYYPHGGGGNSTDFVFPILDADCGEPLKEMPVNDDITMFDMVRPGGRVPRTQRAFAGSDCTLLTSATGFPSERCAFDDSGKPIFLTSDGVATGVTSSTLGYRWILRYSSAGGGAAWCPESGLFQSPGGLYSPELGQPVSQHKEKKKDKPVMQASWDLCVNKKM